MSGLRERTNRDGAEWIRSDWYCMTCGVPNVWQRVDAGDDYYHGHAATCFACGASMCCVDKVEDPEPPKRYWWDNE